MGYAACTVKIDGTMVEVEPNTLDITNTIGQRHQGSFDFHDYAGVTYDDGTVVEVYDPTNTLIYSGFVDTDTYYAPSALTATLYHSISLKDNNYIAERRYIAESYLGVTSGAIANDLFTKYLAPEGVTIGGIASGIAMPPLVYNYQQLSDVLSKLATASGYWWDIDEQKRFWFQPYTGYTAPWTYNGTQSDSSPGNQPKVVRGNRDYRNRQFALGGMTDTNTLTEYQYGDGQKRAFTLRYQVSSVSAVYVNGVAQTLGKKGVDTGKGFYYAENDVVIAQDDSQTVLGSTDTLEVVYKGKYPSIALAQSDSQIAYRQSIEGGGTGYVESVYRDTKMKSLDTAFGLAAALLAHYGQSMKVLTFRTTQSGLKQGMLLPVQVPSLLLPNTTMLIQSVEIREEDENLWYYITAVGSPVESASWQTVWQNLANKADSIDPSNLSSDTVLNLLIELTASMNASATLSLSSWNSPICGSSTICGPTLLVG